MIVYVDNEYICGWYYNSEDRFIVDDTKATTERIEKDVKKWT